MPSSIESMATVLAITHLSKGAFINTPECWNSRDSLKTKTLIQTKSLDGISLLDVLSPIKAHKRTYENRRYKIRIFGCQMRFTLLHTWLVVWKHGIV